MGKIVAAINIKSKYQSFCLKFTNSLNFNKFINIVASINIHIS